MHECKHMHAGVTGGVEEENLQVDSQNVDHGARQGAQSHDP